VSSSYDNVQHGEWRRGSPEFGAEEDFGAEELIDGGLNGIPGRQFMRGAAGQNHNN
jgi:hypothetical protein